MEKHYFTIRTLLLLYLSAMFAAASAQQVSQDEAARIASQFLSAQNQGSRAKKAAPDALKLVYTEPSAKDKTPNLYVFNMEGGGFAIVSADERTGSQILGYSFDNNFSAKGMPDNVKFWLGEYSRQIDFIKTHQPEVSESKRRGGLKMYDAPTPPENVSVVVEPLLSTTWGQSAPYNGMTPLLYGQQTVTGCVATAMAQIMKKWEHPTTGKGKHSYYWWNSGNGGLDLLSADFSGHTYDWTNMTDSYSDVSSLDEKNAVAQLMSDCGVAVDMDYGLTSSGAYDDKVVTALTSYFGYSHNISLKHQSDYNNTDWTKLLTDELDAKRPVYYAAEDDKDDDAHAFVLDGYGTYNSKTYFHINWGWDGYDGTSTTLDNNISNDGYFAMNSFNPIYRNETGNTDYFNTNSVAIVGIYPAENDEMSFDELDEGWDDDDNWGTTENFGTGVWEEDMIYGCAYKDNPTVQTLKRQQNILYPHIYRVTMPNWNESVICPELITTTGIYYRRNKIADLYFYWDTNTNECYLPTQYTELYQDNYYNRTDFSKKDISYQIYANPSEEEDTDYGSYNPITNEFSLNFYSYCLDDSNGDPDKNAAHEDDPVGLLKDISADSNYSYSPNSGMNYKYISKKNQPDDPQYEYKITVLGPTDATLTLTPAQTHKALYLGNFTENLNGTAKQVAGIIKDETGTYRIGLMPVNENTTRSEIYAFAQSLNGDVINKSLTDTPYSLELRIPKEGAYYVVAANYDNNKLVSYEYLPVFYSSSDKWEDINGDCYYDDVLVTGTYDYVGLENFHVKVQQYKGGNLIKKDGDRIFRIVNPYGNEFNNYINSDEYYYDAIIDYYPISNNINGTTDLFRSDVYLYLYVDAEDNVSFYPEYFECQPLGIDWGSGEMFVYQNEMGKFSKDTNDGYNHIKFEIDNSLTPWEYFAEEPLEILAKEGALIFDLQLPSTLKNYLTLTLSDDEPYTFTDEDIEELPDYNGVYYSRELDPNNNWGTLMLPFAFNPADIDADFTFYKLTGASSSQLTFTEIPRNEFSTDVAANTPIIFKRADGSTKSLDVSKVVESGFVALASCNDAISPTYNDVNGWTFKGLYNSGVITKQNAPDELTKCYFFEGDKVRRVTNKITLKQYRGYFHDDQGVLAGAKQLAVIINDEEYTSLDALFNGEQPVKKYGKGRFNLQGQAVGKDYKGVVIEDGRKKIRF